jgi:competence protein ComEC
VVVFVFFLCGIALYFLFPFFPVTGVFFFTGLAVYSLVKRKVFLLAVVAFAVLYAAFRVPLAADAPHIWNREIRATGRFIPRNGTQPAARGIQTFTVDRAFARDTGREIRLLRGKEMGLDTDLEGGFDRRYELLLRTGRDRTRLNPCGAREGRIYGAVSHARVIYGASRSLSDALNGRRNVLNAYILRRFKGDSAALIASVTTGETSYLGDDLKNAFSVTGLAHLLSISGTHFGLFSVMMFGTFLFAIKRLPYKLLQRLTLSLSPAQASAILCIPLVIMYLGISGARPPAVRSFVMISLFLAGLLIGRKGIWLNSLLCAAFVLSIWNPSVVMDLSFLLSFVAVLFIGFSVDGREEGYHTAREGNRTLRFAKRSLILTLAASMGTFPLVAYHFHRFSVISPPANLVAGPLVGFILVPLSMISSFSYLLSGHYLFAPLVSLCADLSVSLVKLMSRIPYAALRFPSFPPVLCILFYVLFIPYLFFGKAKKLLVLPFIPFLLYILLHTFGKKELSITFLDVGQGDSAVVELPDGKTVVIDTGRTGREAAAFLQCMGKKDIDALVVSHSHPDHSGGVSYIGKRLRVREVWDNGMISYPGTDLPRRTLERGDIVESGYCSFTVLHPYRGFYTVAGNVYEEANNSSLVMKISGRRRSFLFTGDVEEEAEEDISHLGKWLPSDVIKIPHHGSRTAANDDFLSAVSPSVAVISAGRENSFGHPSREVLEKLYGRKVYRTDIDGAIKMTETGDGLEIKTFRGFALQRADSINQELRNLRRLFSSW